MSAVKLHKASMKDGLCPVCANNGVARSVWTLTKSLHHGQNKVHSFTFSVCNVNVQPPSITFKLPSLLLADSATKLSKVDGYIAYIASRNIFCGQVLFQSLLFCQGYPLTSFSISTFNHEVIHFHPITQSSILSLFLTTHHIGLNFVTFRATRYTRDMANSLSGRMASHSVFRPERMNPTF